MQRIDAAAITEIPGGAPILPQEDLLAGLHKTTRRRLAERARDTQLFAYLLVGSAK